MTDGISRKADFRKAFLLMIFTLLILALMAIFDTQNAFAAKVDEGYSPLFGASLQNTMRQFEEKERGEYQVQENDAVTEKADKKDLGDTKVVPWTIAGIPGVPSIPSIPSIPKPYVPPTTPSIPTITTSYTCGTTCGSTCLGSSTCAGSNTCAGTSTCVGSSTCAGTSTCIGMSSCAGSSTCFGTNTCSGTSTCGASATCSFTGAYCANPYPVNNGQTLPPASSPLPETDSSPPSVDEPASWAKSDVEKAISLDLIPAHMCGNYSADITRRDLCSVLSQVLIKKNLTTNKSVFDEKPKPFNDTDDVDVAWLNSLGVVSGVGNGAFNPSGLISRQEAAVMLKRAAIALGAEDSGAQSGSFYDQDQVAAWARDSLGFVVAKGIMSGTGDNMFSPLGMYTRQQSYVTMLRLYNAVSDIDIGVSESGAV
ncbi:MAG: S-layer homology domain-containing protein [Syntrophomonadaceae bacterium]|jgi:hypothetical protein|nr:S-layer homology domain-containing protein [Syntrophomonadaceae bacterium]